VALHGCKSSSIEDNTLVLLTICSDGRQMWQVCAAIFLVGGTSVGAFILSYNTPTVGLGCRTGGYMIFIVVALVLLIAEILVWWLTSPLRKQDLFHTHLETYSKRLEQNGHKRQKHTSFPGLATSKAFIAYMLGIVERGVLSIATLVLRLYPSKNKKRRIESTQMTIRAHFSTLQNLTTRNWFQRAFFTPLECFNMIWACYLIFAQTVGAFNNCGCMTSSWGGLGGYLDFTQFNVADSPMVLKSWIQGTVVTCVVMSLGMGYIVLEVRQHLFREMCSKPMFT
jgi:hypothetical protein